MFANNHHDDGHIAIWLPVRSGLQALLVNRASKVLPAAYVTVRGWVGVELDEVDDEELASHIVEAWRLIAPKKLQASMARS